MFVSGLQKLTLLDYPGQVACTVFTGGCNLRCPFCHNASLVLPERLEPYPGGVEAVLAFLKKRQGILDGVAVTGGEPLMQPDLPDFLRQVRALGYRVKLDTNGTFPERLEAVLDEGLADYVAMDLKNAPALYEKTVGRGVDLAAIERSRDLLLAGRVNYEFRTTVVRGLHTLQSLQAAGRWIEGARAWYWQPFRDSGELIAPDGLGAYSGGELRTLFEAVQPVFPALALRGVD